MWNTLDAFVGLYFLVVAHAHFSSVAFLSLPQKVVPEYGTYNIAILVWFHFHTQPDMEDQACGHMTLYIFNICHPNKYALCIHTCQVTMLSESEFPKKTRNLEYDAFCKQSLNQRNSSKVNQ